MNYRLLKLKANMLDFKSIGSVPNPDLVEIFKNPRSIVVVRLRNNGE